MIGFFVLVYLWVKVLYVMVVIVWMVGFFYLFWLFVYYVECGRVVEG